MRSIDVRNVNHALPIALALLRDTGQRISPRGQETLEIPGPFATTYRQVEEMVLFDPIRDANPHFHFFEALWILEGRQDVGFLAYFLPRMADFSDDNKVFNAPYGHRLRTIYGFDQIELAIKKLKADPDTRQVVLSIWHPQKDWQRTKDVPCNDMIMLKIRDGKLRMTVCNRSNDAVLGAYGANVVQFSTLQRYIAGRVGVETGEYTQMSDSFHVYTSNPYWQTWLNFNSGGGVVTPFDPYTTYYDPANRLDPGSVDDKMRPVKGGTFMTDEELSAGDFDYDLKKFFENWDMHNGPNASICDPANYVTESFKETMCPMLAAVMGWKAGAKIAAYEVSNDIAAPDWRLAVRSWMHRRLAKGETA